MKTSNTRKRLEEYMIKNDLRPVDLIRILELPKSTISQYLNEDREPRQDRLTTMAEKLGVSEPWLAGYDVPMDSKSPKFTVNGLPDYSKHIEKENADYVNRFISYAIKLTRIQKNLTEKTVAEMSGLTLDEYLNIESGEDINSQKVLQIIKSLGGNPSFFVGQIYGIESGLSGCEMELKTKEEIERAKTRVIEKAKAYYELICNKKDSSEEMKG